jgi:hypothetical protein
MDKKLRSLINVLIMEIFTITALSLFKTLESIATPGSVNTSGNFCLPPLPFFDMPIWHIKDL